MNRKVPISLTLLALLLGGCAVSGGSRDFACPEPDGVSCRSALEVYEALDRGERLDQGKSAAPATDAEPRAMPASAGVVEGADGVLTFDMPAPAAPSAPLSGILPLRTAARVMRIWVSPWEDSHGDLVMASHVYTEIEGRRWRVGLPAPRTSDGTLRLIQGASKAKPADPPAPAGAAETGRTDPPATSTNGRT